MACFLIQACNNIDLTHSFDVPVASDTLQPEIILPNQYIIARNNFYPFIRIPFTIKIKNTVVISMIILKMAILHL